MIRLHHIRGRLYFVRFVNGEGLPVQHFSRAWRQSTYRSAL